MKRQSSLTSGAAVGDLLAALTGLDSLRIPRSRIFVLVGVVAAFLFSCRLCIFLFVLFDGVELAVVDGHLLRRGAFELLSRQVLAGSEAWLLTLSAAAVMYVGELR